jgi:hypothetical protein
MCTWNWTLYFNQAQRFFEFQRNCVIVNKKIEELGLNLQPKNLSKLLTFKIVKARTKGFFEKEKPSLIITIITIL